MKYLLYLLPLIAGGAVALQSTINAQLRTAVGSPYVAGLVSFSAGTVLFLVIVIVTRQPIPTRAALGDISLYKFAGGFLGAFFITISILMVQRLGVATLFSLILSGQLITALIFDHFGILGLNTSPITPAKAIGVLLLIIGAYLINRK